MFSVVIAFPRLIAARYLDASFLTPYSFPVVEGQARDLPLQV